ncbi:MAG: insulinase family protein [Bacteroidota bacterium]|nr:insulinase family protein [Odoribacter sp.]MDP3642145.1 insulinase family protein [Bacteroidota bacterium]
MIKFRLILIIALVQLSGMVFSQNPLNQPVPTDPAVRMGKLANGMTYYIRHNEEPKERASFYMIQNVGALLENDDQNGLAHFLEHMALNGTQHFPGKGIINTLEKHGVQFGRNINAGTSHTETVYNLSDIPVKHEGLIDTCLLVLNDWSDFLLLTNEEIDAERGVITEEWRTRRTAGFRMQRQWLPVLLNGSKYMTRDVIGDLDVIKNFKYETLRKFYHDWYRADLQAIAIVGDIDVDAVEQKVKALFSKIEAVENAPKREFYEVPVHKEPLYVLATDKEASSYSVSLYIKHRAPEASEKTLGYLREQTIQTLFGMMARDRITELLQKGVPPFVTGNIGYGEFVRGYEVFSVSTSSKPDQDDLAFKSIYTEAQRIYKHGFTSGELERAKTNLFTSYESRYKQRDKINNDQFADDIQNHYLTGEPLTSIDFDWEFIQKILPTISVEDVSARAKQWMTPENRVIVVMGPDNPEAKHLSKEQALAIINEVENSQVDPYSDKVVSSNLISKELMGSKVKSTKQLPEFNAVEWTLGNETKVVFRQADYEKDQVALIAMSNGGSSKINNDKVASAMMLNQFIGSFGVGDYDATALKKALTGKKVSLNVGLSDLNETFNGSATPKDFETMMQLLYLQFENPRFDKEAYEAMLGRYKAFVANMANNPQKIMSDSLSLILTCKNPRTKLMTPELFNEISLEQMETIYMDRFVDAGDFTYLIVGNIDEATAKAMTEKYIGSLTNLPRKENWIDRNVEGPKGKTVREIEIPMEVKKTTVNVIFDAKMDYTPEQNLLLSVFRDILTMRYDEEIREKEGGTYGVRVSTNSSKFPKAEKNLNLMFDTDPEKAQYLKSILYSEIEKIAANGPTAEDLDKAVKNLQKNREQAKLHNNYWLQALNTFYTYNINTTATENYETILEKMTIPQVQNFVKTFTSKADVVDIVFKPKP